MKIDFDNHFKQFNRVNNIILVLVVAGFVAGISLIGVGVYIAIHFLSKVW